MTLLIIGIIVAGIVVAVLLNKKEKSVSENQNHISDIVEEKPEQVTPAVEVKTKKPATKKPAAKKPVAKKSAKKSK